MQFVFRHLRWQLNIITQQTENRQANDKIGLDLFLQFALTLENNLERFARSKTVLVLILSRRCARKTVWGLKNNLFNNFVNGLCDFKR